MLCICQLEMRSFYQCCIIQEPLRQCSMFNKVLMLFLIYQNQLPFQQVQLMIILYHSSQDLLYHLFLLTRSFPMLDQECICLPTFHLNIHLQSICMVSMEDLVKIQQSPFHSSMVSSLMFLFPMQAKRYNLQAQGFYQLSSFLQIS